jgi:hypothetical protein
MEEEHTPLHQHRRPRKDLRSVHHSGPAIELGSTPTSAARSSREYDKGRQHLLGLYQGGKERRGRHQADPREPAGRPDQGDGDRDELNPLRAGQREKLIQADRDELNLHPADPAVQPEPARRAGALTVTATLTPAH